MEDYPEDLLVGVFPLVFAVNAIRAESDPAAQQQQQQQAHSSRSSLFERFLDAVAASLLDESGEGILSATGSHDSGDGDVVPASATKPRRSGGGLFRNTSNNTTGTDDDASSDDEDLLEGISGTAHYQHGGSSSASGHNHARRRVTGALSSGLYAGFGRRAQWKSSGADDAASNNSTHSTSGVGAGTSYAKALTHGQGFFQRARIESVSVRHGFPPSKDPSGTNNLAHAVASAAASAAVHKTPNKILSSSASAAAAASTIAELVQQYLPVQGIVSAGWLEKHVHALPSVILVVTTVSATAKEQDAQDSYLYQTVEHLQFSLVPKRPCPVIVIGLLADNVTLIQADGWSRAVTQEILANSAATSVEDSLLSSGSSSGNNTSLTSSTSDPLVKVTLLRASTDLQSTNETGLPSSQALKRLHRQVRDASLSYYQTQARRTKQKLAKLLVLQQPAGSHPDDTGMSGRRHFHKKSDGIPAAAAAAALPEPILPLAIRYCFKIALFYEFQWKLEKSVRFMAEAYRLTVKYYQYLMQQQQHKKLSSTKQETPSVTTSSTTATSRTTDSPTRSRSTGRGDEYGTSALATTDTDEGLEVALHDPSSSSSSMPTSHNDVGSTTTTAAPWWLDESIFPAASDDMILQCRAVADWFNLKLLFSGLVSHTEGGLLASADQWRLHSRIFCTPLNSKGTNVTDLQETSAWFEWSYIARQRLVMSQLVERHPPKALGTFGNKYDEVLLRCSPWRTYESAVEAYLRLAREIDHIRWKQQQQQGGGMAELSSSSTDPMRAPYVGGLDSEGLLPYLRKEIQIDHREKALELVLRAISLYEKELEKEKRGFYAEDNFRERSSSRTGARLHYLAGGILLGKHRHKEAVHHLEKASKYARGWHELERAVRRMLIECYEKHMPSPSEATESSQTLASMILDSYFNADMSSRDLRRALEHFASMSGSGDSSSCLKWYHDTVDEEDLNLPFSFSVTFPEAIFATIGDTVKASVLIKSNLDYAVHVNSVVLSSLAGDLPIPTNDLLRATNAMEGSEGGGIIIQRNGEIVISTEVELPKDLSIIAADDSGNGGEMQGVAGKGSFAKSARPRTAGITSAGGARLLNEDHRSPENKASQGWSLRFLGGKPLRCDGMKLVFYPVQVERATGSSEKVTLIELTIEKKKPRTAANIKRTPFEEENYIASAWSRPQRLPFSCGPRSLRVLGPQPQLVITNVTEPVTDGRALEGTVNRVLLKLQSGPHERCADMKIRVSCFSVLVTPTGSTKRLVSRSELTTAEAESSVDMKNPIFRTPVLVLPNGKSDTHISTDYGFEIPVGWTLAESGQGYQGPALEPLKEGESTFVHLDLFRPSPFLQQSLVTNDNGLDEALNVDECMCKTDFYVTVTYRQERPAAQKQKQRARRTARRRPVKINPGAGVSAEGPQFDTLQENPSQDGGDHGNDSSDEVSLEYNGSILWSKAILATFSSGTKTTHPCGSRDPFNSIEGAAGSIGNADLSVVDGDSVTTRCTLQAASDVTGLKAKLVAVRFQDNDISEPLSLGLQSGVGGKEEGLIHRALPGDPFSTLMPGSKFTTAFTVKAVLRDGYKKGGFTSQLGAVLVDWLPSSLPLPAEAEGSTALVGIVGHGPLALAHPATITFAGPPCYIERAPFEAELEPISDNPRVAIPFEVNYKIANKTGHHQLVSVSMADVSGDDPSFGGGLLVSGLISGELALAPGETQTLSYTALATRAGKLSLPKLFMSSKRYKSWIINESLTSNGPLYVFP